MLATETRECVDNGEIEDDVARALSIGFPLVTQREGAPKETLVVAQSVARFGYMARVAEWERLSTAREPEGWMIAGLQGAVESSVAEELRESDDGEKSFYDALAEVTAFFVRREPLDVPYDANQGFVLMWTIPGVGGEVRALLREKTLPMVLQRDGAGPEGPNRPDRGCDPGGLPASLEVRLPSSQLRGVLPRRLLASAPSGTRERCGTQPAPRGQDRGPWVVLTSIEETI